jgi:gamma-glutamylcyclotransferase (GGCT)/AIG2-like uncharacterized protein YtfP
MRRKYYLAYGMNTNLSSMAFRCPAARSLGKVELKNHKLAFKIYCDAVKQPNTSMECVLWTITDACESSLDRLEGYPHFYQKKEVSVQHDNKTIRAMIYYMPREFQLDTPSQSYVDTVSTGYQEHDISTEQIVKALEELEQCTSLSEKMQPVN